MNKIKCCMVVAVVLSSVMTYAAKDNPFKFQNSVRVGYDDNVYSSSVDEQDTAFITDILNITGTLDFSERSALELYWQPEIRYRVDADPELITYQNLYARLDHDVSERVSLEVSDRFRYQEKDGRSDLTGNSSIDQNYLENDLQGVVGYSLSRVGQVRVGGAYELRVWDDDNYGEVRGNNYDQFRLNGSYIHVLDANTTYAVGGVNYVDLEYEGSRGGFDSVVLFGGVDHNFNPNMSGSANVGYSFSTVDNQSQSSDSSSPYLQAGMDYKPTERTSVNGTLSYSLSQSENSVYNAADTFDLGLGVRHDITAKISAVGSLKYVFAMYDSDYANIGLGDAEENYIRLSLRGSYQINRNNFVDLGYEYSTRDSDSPATLQEFDRNRVDIGWRVRF